MFTDENFPFIKQKHNFKFTFSNTKGFRNAI